MNPAQAIPSISECGNQLVQLSQEFVYRAKTASSLDFLFAQLQQLDEEELFHSLNTDEEKKSFWINIYNGFLQATLRKEEWKYKNKKQLFDSSFLDVAGKKLSLDLIEHGILRRSKIKWSLGYLNRMFPSRLEKQLRVQQLDYRIHFALNCGAASCPPIAFYKVTTIELQLDMATKSYLSAEVEYDQMKNILRLPAIMSWFRADFGGKAGMMSLLKQYGILNENEFPAIEFRSFDWTLNLHNYSN